MKKWPIWNIHKVETNQYWWNTIVWTNKKWEPVVLDYPFKKVF